MREKAKVEITRADLGRETYAWGKRYDPRYCGQRVYSCGLQCHRKPKPGTLWCGFHSPEAEARGNAKRQARNEKLAAAFKQRHDDALRRDALAEIAPELAKAVRTLRGLAVAEAYWSLGELLDRYDSIVGKADSNGGACGRP